MQTQTTDLYTKNLSLKLCAQDVLVALTALQLTGVLLQAGLNGLDISIFATNKTAHFLAIAAFPSMLFGIIIAYTAKNRGMAVQTAKTAISIMVSYILFLMLKESSQASRLGQTEFIWGLTFFAALSLASEAGRRARTKALVSRRVLLVGNGPLAHQMEQLILDTPNRFVLVGSIDYPMAPQLTASEDVTNDILDTAKSLGANKVLISLTERRGIFPLQEMLRCKLSGIEVLDAPDIYERITGKLLIENITPSWFIFCHGFRVTPLLRFAKRFVDIAISSLGLIMFAPFAPLVAMAIKLDSPGPIFFRQVRVGQGDNTFELIKFRSMSQDAEKHTGAVWASKNDSRVTRLGRILRKTRIDEIPQLINVLKGEMSLVGPRPERPEFVQKLKELIPYYSERHYVKPGVSGWAQVRYPYGASVEDAVEKLRFDMYYIKNISLILDIKIILQTLAVMLFCKGGR